MIRKTPARRRRGAAVVEFAIVSTVTLLFLFGVFEYARFVFFMQVVSNAAREGARYAAVHTGDGTTTANIVTQVTDKMAGRQNELTGYTVTVNNVDPATGTIKSSSWENSGLGEAIAVRIQGTYRPLLPSFLRMPTTINIDMTSMMASETN